MWTSWLTQDRFAPSLLCIHTLWVESLKSSEKVIERKIENSIRAKIQLFLIPFPTSNGSKSSPLKLSNVFIPACKADMRLTKSSEHPSFHRMLHSTSLFTMSKLFVKLTAIMYKCIFSSIHFSCISWKEKIMSMVLQSAQNPHCASNRISSTRVDSLLSSMQANLFPGMERRKILWALLQF